MNFRMLCHLGMGVTLPFGLAFLLVPSATLALYGLSDWSAGQLFIARLFGVHLIFLTAVLAALRGLDDASLQWRIALGMGIVNVVAALVTVQAVWSGAVNPLTWSTAAIYGFFALGWGRIVVGRG